MLHYTRLESLTRDKHVSLLVSFVSYKDNEVFEYNIRVLNLHGHDYLLITAESNV